MLIYGNEDYMKSRMRENRTYGSVRGDRLPLTKERKRGVVELSTRQRTMKKKILIGLGIVVLVVIGVIGYMVITDLQQEDKLLQEVDEITALTNEDPIDVDKLRDKLDNTITRGDYGTTERALKDYVSDLVDNYEIIYNALNDDTMINILSIDNYKEDGKEFTESREYLSTTQDNLKSAMNNYVELLTEEGAMKYINDKGLDSYYVDLYRDELVGEIPADDVLELETAINDVISLLDKEEAVIEFLVQNKDNWEIQGDNIVFDSNDLTNEYLGLVDEIAN